MYLIGRRIYFRPLRPQFERPLPVGRLEIQTTLPEPQIRKEFPENWIFYNVEKYEKPNGLIYFLCSVHVFD